MSRRSSTVSHNHALFGDAPIPLRPAARPPSEAIKTTTKEPKAPEEVLPFSVRPPSPLDVPRAGSAPKGSCSGCGAATEGHYGVISEDGQRTLPLCDKCGPGYHPTIQEVWARVAGRSA